jgi:hypothetical protein
MGHINESIDLNATAEVIWNYVQDHRRRREWDRTVRQFEPIGGAHPDKGVMVRIRSAGFPAIEYEAIYVSFQPYTVSALTLVRPIRNSLFASAAGSWRYHEVTSGTTRFTITFDYDLVGGAIGALFDRVIMEPAIRRGIQLSLDNLRSRFGR